MDPPPQTAYDIGFIQEIHTTEEETGDQDKDGRTNQRTVDHTQPAFHEGGGRLVEKHGQQRRRRYNQEQKPEREKRDRRKQQRASPAVPV